VNVRVEEEPRSRLLEHGQIPIAFLAERVLVGSVIDAGLGGITLAEAEVDQPWEKEYEAIKGEGPPQSSPIEWCKSGWSLTRSLSPSWLPGAGLQTAHTAWPGQTF
jgi:hypothetical protein